MRSSVFHPGLIPSWLWWQTRVWWGCRRHGHSALSAIFGAFKLCVSGMRSLFCAVLESFESCLGALHEPVFSLSSSLTRRRLAGVHGSCLRYPQDCGAQLWAVDRLIPTFSHSHSSQRVTHSGHLSRLARRTGVHGCLVWIVRLCRMFVGVGLEMFGKEFIGGLPIFFTSLLACSQATLYPAGLVLSFDPYSVGGYRIMAACHLIYQ